MWTSTFQRELRGFALNSCAALRRQLIGKKASICEGIWTLEQCKKVMWWVQIYPVPEWWAHQDRKKGRWCDASIRQCDVNWLTEYTEWPGYTITRSMKMTFWNSMGSNCEREVQEAWDIILDPGLATRVQTITPLRIFGHAVQGFAVVQTHPLLIQDLDITLMQHWMEIKLVTLQKLIKTMPQQMGAIIKPKEGPMTLRMCVTFFFFF